MQHKSVRRDPTIVLVAGLVLVVGLLVWASSLGGGDSDVTSPTSATVPATGQPDLDGDGVPDVAPTESTPTPSAPATSEPPRTKPLGKGRSVCVPTLTDSRLVVVSYNIKSGHGGGSLASIASVLADSEADVVLLQEVDRLRRTSGGVDMPAWFGAQLGMYHAFGQNVSHGGSAGYGTAILSKYPIVSTLNTYLPRPGNTQQRGLLHVVIDVDGKPVSLYDTHLQNKNEPARMLQAAAINRIVAADPNPQVLGGDFNAQPNSRPMGVLKQHWVDTWGTVGVGDGRTHPAHRLRGRIDFLLHANPGITAVSSDVLPAKLSDHMAVRALYTIEGPDEETCLRVFPGSGVSAPMR